MKMQTYESYRVRLNKVADYLYDHLDDDIGHDDLAQVACLSTYHWHRIYSAMCGETIATTLRRLRLLRAADRLANSDLDVKMIGQRAGYGSVDAFGRAFKDTYGQTPAAYRASGSHAVFKSASTERDATGFPIETLTLPPVRCAAAAHKGSYLQIDHAMGRLFSEMSSSNLPMSGRKMLAVFLDDPDLVRADQLRSFACTPIGEADTIAPPLVENLLREGLYAKLLYKGPYADMKEAYRWLLGVWLPSSGYEADDAPIFEAYLNSPIDVPPPELLTEIHLPLKAE